MNFIDIKESAYMAVDTVRANKLRSSLTILGVSVGVITVMFMVSIIQGLNKAFAAQVESLGSNTNWALKFDPSFGHQPTTEEIHRKELTVEDADTIRREAPSIVGVAPFYRKIAETVRKDERTYRGFNLFAKTDVELFTALVRGEFHISGFKNASLRALLPSINGAQLSRVLKRLRMHGLIKKVGHTYKYYLTALGKRAALTALKLRELVVIPSLAGTAVA